MSLVVVKIYFSSQIYGMTYAKIYGTFVCEKQLLYLRLGLKVLLLLLLLL